MAGTPPVDGPCCPPDAPVTADLPTDEARADAMLAAFAKALGHPVRVRILRSLAKRDARRCAAIVDELPLAQSTVSEHLRVLREAGLVRANTDGPTTTYCVVPSALATLRALLAALRPDLVEEADRVVAR